MTTNVTVFDEAAAARATVALMRLHEADVNAALFARYFCLLGLVILVHDNFATFTRERRLVWPARASFSKAGFLFNRYAVPFCLLVMFLPLSGFVGLDFTDTACQYITSIAGTLAMMSMALGNGLVLIRVVDLWDHNHLAARFMIGGFIIAYTTTVATFLVALADIFTAFTWDPVLSMCVARDTSAWFIPASAAPLVFELLVLGATCWNAVDRPRSAHMGLGRALQRDGIAFFVVLTLARATNLALVSAQRPALVMLASLVTWSLVTLVSNRSLLAFAQAELEDAMRAPSRSGRRSPFGIRAADDEDPKIPNWEAGAVEVGHVEVERD